EGRQLDAASAALTAGGSMLAGQLGARLGLDNAGVSESRALGGSVLGIGKQLSPRLYLGFGVSLLGTGQVITLKYLLRRGFDVEIETSTLETRGAINYRHESDWRPAPAAPLRGSGGQAVAPALKNPRPRPLSEPGPTRAAHSTGDTDDRTTDRAAVRRLTR